IPAISAEQVSKSQNSIVEFEKSKILILLADENLETLDDYDLDVDYLRAAGETDGDGNYSVEQVPSGNYYVFGILLDEDAFAYGYYDGNNDNSPDLISVENQSVDNVDFNLFGFEGSLDEFIDSDYMKETV